MSRQRCRSSAWPLILPAGFVGGRPRAMVAMALGPNTVEVALGMMARILEDYRAEIGVVEPDQATDS